MSGKTVWKAERTKEINRAGEFKKACSTPQIITVGGKDQLISVNNDGGVASCLNKGTGWRSRGVGGQDVKEPLAR
jgi:hypothetical protein